MWTREYATAAASARSGTARTGSSPATAPANANAEAEWPDGNDVLVGIVTQRSSGTPALSRSGRPRLLAVFMGMFTRAEFRPIAATPVRAARRPLLPPTTKIPAAIANQSIELLANPDRRRSGSSSVGVGVLAIAPYTARSTFAIS